MNKLFYIVFFLLIQPYAFTQGNTALLQDKLDFVEIMVEHFEGRVCNFYGLEKEQTHIALKKFVDDSSDNFNQIDKSKLISIPKSKELLLNSRRELASYIWISQKERRQNSQFRSYSELEPHVIKSLDKNTITYLKELEKTDHYLVVNYYGSYAKNILNNCLNKDIQDLIITFREVPDNNPSSVASALKDLTEKDFKNKAVKTFIAFELYYNILNLDLTNE